jgi:hypothetical protein
MRNPGFDIADFLKSTIKLRFGKFFCECSACGNDALQTEICLRLLELS